MTADNVNRKPGVNCIVCFMNCIQVKAWAQSTIFMILSDVHHCLYIVATIILLGKITHNRFPLLNNTRLIISLIKYVSTVYMYVCISPSPPNGVHSAQHNKPSCPGLALNFLNCRIKKYVFMAEKMETEWQINNRGCVRDSYIRDCVYPLCTPAIPYTSIKMGHSSRVNHSSLPTAPGSTTPHCQQFQGQPLLIVNSSRVNHSSLPTAPGSTTPHCQQLQGQALLTANSSKVNHSSLPTAPGLTTPHCQQIQGQPLLTANSSRVNHSSLPFGASQ